MSWIKELYCDTDINEIPFIWSVVYYINYKDQNEMIEQLVGEYLEEQNGE